ncbi:MAG TPA: prepilin-type N-terminal cleavage/methylation domain-containing protein, partial [Planctomycetota bacterium]|nr:prepilin-type N-terminal cleavage/methylation domain-containing protein [Planctomycetota bacterium]
MKNRTSRSSGFTLIEIIVVLALITLLAGVVVPMVSGVSSQG